MRFSWPMTRSIHDNVEGTWGYSIVSAALETGYDYRRHRRTQSTLCPFNNADAALRSISFHFRGGGAARFLARHLSTYFTD